MAYGSSSRYIGMTPKKMAAHYKYTNDMLKICTLDWSKASMSPIKHCRMLPQAMGPLTSLESIAEVPEWQVAKTGKSSIL